MSECGAKVPNDLKMGALLQYLQAISTNAAQTRSSKLYIVRDFVKFLSEQGLSLPDIANALPLIPRHKHSSVPSAYTPEEISNVFDAIDSTRCPLRNKAIFLLASILGMRAGDIRALKLSDIDWRDRILRFTQSKTKITQVLPLPEPVMLALADYIKNERPDIDDNHVFITANAPYRSFEDSSYVFHRTISHYFERGEVNTAGKHHGLHSFRHSATTAMLANYVSYPVIASVLGHSSSNVTRRYLSIDTENLRPLALEIPDGIID